jgi:hypothetical protein
MKEVAAEACSRNSTSILFDETARTAANFRLGVLRCVFPQTAAATDIEMKRLLSVFGDHIHIELR